jgi:hypothetical protein
VSPLLIGLELLLRSLNPALLGSGLPVPIVDGRYGEDELYALFSGRSSSVLCACLAAEGSSPIELAQLGARDPV